MSVGSLIVAVGIALASAPQAEGTSLPTTSAPVVPAQATAPEKICKKFIPTGSIMPKKFCLTKQDWAEFDAKTRAGAEGFLARRSAGHPVEGD